MRITVTRDQRVVWIDLIVDARADGDIPAGHYHTKSQIKGIQIGVQHRGFDELVIINFAALKIHKVRSLLLFQRTTEIAAILPQLKRRTLAGAGSEGVS